MYKTPKIVYFVFTLAILIIIVLAGGLYYEKYLKPINCDDYDLNYCPERCAICTTCQTCSDLTCRDIKKCKDAGMYEEWFERVRPKEPQLSTYEETIRKVYEPAFKQINCYDHFEFASCGDNVCTKIVLKNDCPEMVKKLPETIDGMRVITEVISPSSASKNHACGIENCHGPDFTCGPNIPEACSEIYMFGDGCRRFAKCEIRAGKCQKVPIEDFDKCKACSENCSNNFKNDNVKMFECEANCWQKNG